MLGASIHDDGFGMPVLEIVEDDGLIRVIAMKALASYSELWGISDPMETLEAIMADQDRPKAPGELSPYMGAYTLLGHREKAREEAVREALKKRDDKLAPADPRSPALVGALAAYRAVHVPVAPGEECAMDRCRRETRNSVQISFEPTKKCGATSRHTSIKVKKRDHPDAPFGPLTKEDAGQQRVAQLSELLGQVTWMIDNHRREFLHELSGNEDNPLEDVAVPVEARPDPTPEELLAKYGAVDA